VLKLFRRMFAQLGFLLCAALLASGTVLGQEGRAPVLEGGVQEQDYELSFLKSVEYTCQVARDALDLYHKAAANPELVSSNDWREVNGKLDDTGRGDCECPFADASAYIKRLRRMQIARPNPQARAELLGELQWELRDERGDLEPIQDFGSLQAFDWAMQKENEKIQKSLKSAEECFQKSCTEALQVLREQREQEPEGSKDCGVSSYSDSSDGNATNDDSRITGSGVLSNAPMSPIKLPAGQGNRVPEQASQLVRIDWVMQPVYGQEPEEPTLNGRIVDFVQQNYGKRVGDGSCWSLAAKAYESAGAKMFPPYGKDVDHVWGDRIATFTPGSTPDLRDLKPGDVLQFRNVQILQEIPPGGKFPRGGWHTLNYRHHTAVVVGVDVDRITIEIFEQHTSPEGGGPVRPFVTRRTLDLRSYEKEFRSGNTKESKQFGMVSGTIWAYHPVPK